MIMKKSIFIVFALLLLISVAGLTGCNIEEEKYKNGRDGNDGRDGLSAYEIFCKNYIYIDSEKQWIDEFVSGTLERIDNSVLEDKLYWYGDVNDDFVEGDVLLWVDKYFYQKRFTAEDFHMIEVEKAELTDDYHKDDQPYNQWYKLTLKEKSKQAVVDAIHKLEIYAFTKMACPNEIFYPTNVV